MNTQKAESEDLNIFAIISVKRSILNEANLVQLIIENLQDHAINIFPHYPKMPLRHTEEIFAASNTSPPK